MSQPRPTHVGDPLPDRDARSAPPRAARTTEGGA